MKVPSGMQVSQDILDEHGVKDTKYLSLLQKKITGRFVAGWVFVQSTSAFEVG